MRRLEVSALAAREIDDLYLYGIVTYGIRQADDYARELRQRLNQLAQMPFVGVARADIRPDIRLLVFKAHNVLYRVADDAVLIVRVLHRSADWTNRL